MDYRFKTVGLHYITFPILPDQNKVLRFCSDLNFDVFSSILTNFGDTLSRIGRVRVPVLIIHGDRDEVISYDFGKQLYEAANAPKSLWTVRGAMHNDLHIVGRAEFRDRLSRFYASCRK